MSTQIVPMTWRMGVIPDPNLTISQWADEYRTLSPKAAAEPGRWRTERTPYLREIMDALSPHTSTQRIIFMKGAQIGGTEAGNNWIGYVIHLSPAPMMAVSPTTELAKRNSKQRIDPLIEDCAALKERVKPARSRDSGNTVLSKDFPGGVLVMTGANSAVGLRSMPARYLFMDEVDGYPGDIEGEGDPIVLAERRSATFQTRRKIFLVSTPTLKGLSRINREFEQTDQRYYQVPCPHCQHFQALRFGQLRWEEGCPVDVAYQCESCDELIAEHHKTDLLANGKWVATNDNPQQRHTVGYHLSSLYSPIGWFSWSDAANLYEQAKAHPELMKSFVNTVLGEPYEEEHDAPDWEVLYQRREAYPQGIVPIGGLFLTAGVDIQKDRIECEVTAWSRDKQSFSVHYAVLAGDTARSEVWRQLALLLQKDWPHASGHTLPIRVMAVDSGYATQDVYAWVKQHPQAIWGGGGARANQPRTVVAVKGSDRDTALILSASKTELSGKRRGLRVWNVSSSVAKVELYRWLKLEGQIDDDNVMHYPSGYCHFPPYEPEYFKQLTAEKRIIRIHRGYPKAVWEKDPTRRNEALDCRVYARAAASIYGLDRFNEHHWQQFLDALGKPPPVPPATVTVVKQDNATVSAQHKPSTIASSSTHFMRAYIENGPQIQLPDDPYLQDDLSDLLD